MELENILKRPFIEILKEEVKELAISYKWSWSEEDYCFYNENGDDIFDAVTYNCDGYLCNAKLLNSYLSNYLKGDLIL